MQSAAAESADLAEDAVNTEKDSKNPELDEYAAFTASPNRSAQEIVGPTGQESIDQPDHVEDQPEAEVDQPPSTSILATAIYNYKRSNADELSFTKGETLEIISQDDDHWWVAKKGDFSGYVPSNYLQIIE